MRQRKLTPFALAILLSLKTAVAANLVVNPAFTHDLAGWSLADPSSGTLSLDRSVGMLVAPFLPGSPRLSALGPRQLQQHCSYNLRVLNHTSMDWL